MAKGENIYKRKDGRWEGRYPKGRKPNGMLYYGYIYGKSYRSVRAQVLEKKVSYQINTDLALRTFQGTFLVWSHFWLEESVANRVKPSTYASYQTKLRVHILPILGKKTLGNIQESDIKKVVEHLRGCLSPSSLHSVFRGLTQCLEEAKKQGYLLMNPCHSVTLPPIPKKKIAAFSWQEQHQLMQACQRKIKALPVLLALEAGLCIGEVCGLQWSDIDFTDSLLHVRRTVQRVSQDNKTTLIVGTPKTGQSFRSIPLTTNLKKALQEAYKEGQSSYVVSATDKNGPIDPRTVCYRFSRIKEQLGGLVGSFHALRHSFASRCIALGGSIAAVSALLGHASIKMTLDTYTSSFLEDQRTVIAKLNTMSF